MLEKYMLIVLNELYSFSDKQDNNNLRRENSHE
jgi:hypothetical protein